MLFTMTYKNVDLHEPMETGAAPHIVKLEKLLQSYSQDAVLLHGVIAKSVKKEEYLLTLTLTIPTGKLHCVGKAENIRKSLKTCFAELEGSDQEAQGTFEARPRVETQASPSRDSQFGVRSLIPGRLAG